MSEYNAAYVFDCILRDNNFMECIDEYITSTIASAKTFDTRHVPQMVLIIMTLLDTNNNYVDVKKTIKDDAELQALLELFYVYILNKIMKEEGLAGFNKKEFKQSFDICCRLAILKLKYKNKNSFFCIGKK